IAHEAHAGPGAGAQLADEHQIFKTLGHSTALAIRGFGGSALGTDQSSERRLSAAAFGCCKSEYRRSGPVWLQTLWFSFWAAPTAGARYTTCAPLMPEWDLCQAGQRGMMNDDKISYGWLSRSISTPTLSIIYGWARCLSSKLGRKADGDLDSG